ncbi:MAG: HNH endonuclease [Chloroflexi bacterium]|nr:HNH endonuclease [Chloroflexota bacterium]
MSKRKSVRGEFWATAFIVAIVGWALLADWWKDNSALGWSLLGVMVIALGLVLYRSPTVRGWLGRTARVAAEKAVFEDNIASDREPIPPEKRRQVLARTDGKCAVENCNQSVRPHIHHIDMNNRNNDFRNLIALCPNCHQKAHNGDFTQSQLWNWVNRDFQQFKKRRASLRSR